eukprot:1804074-Amphidinium_carterae.1
MLRSLDLEHATLAFSRKCSAQVRFNMDLNFEGQRTTEVNYGDIIILLMQLEDATHVGTLDR